MARPRRPSRRWSRRATRGCPSRDSVPWRSSYARTAKLPRMSPDAKAGLGDADDDADAITPAVLGMGSPTMVPAGVQELVAQRLSRARKQNRGARHAKRAEGLA